MTGLPRGYDQWRTRSPDDQYAIDHPEKYRRGVYTIKMMRTIEATIEIEVEAGSEDDARDDAIVTAKQIPLEQWSFDQDDYETVEVNGPPGPDPDIAREDRYDDR